MTRQTIQEMVSFLSDKGLITEYDKSIPSSPLVKFSDGQGIYFDSGLEFLREYLEGMVKAVELMERIKNYSEGRRQEAEGRRQEAEGRREPTFKNAGLK